MKRVYFFSLLLVPTLVLAEPKLIDISFGGDNDDKFWMTNTVELAANNVSAYDASKLELSTNQYSKRWFSLQKIHQYAGVGALLLATATLLAPKPEYDGIGDPPKTGIHPSLAVATTAMGLFTVGSGAVFHLKDLNYSKGFYRDPDNWHALLGTLAVSGMVMAVRDGGRESHAPYGAGGFGTMLVAVKLVW